MLVQGGRQRYESNLIEAPLIRLPIESLMLCSDKFQIVEVYVLNNKIKLVTTSLIPTEIKVYFDEKEIPIHEDEVTIGRSTVEPHQDVVTLIKTGDVLHVKLPHFGIHLIDTGHDVHIKVSTKQIFI